MKGIKVIGENKVSISHTPTPTPSGHEAVVKIMATCICGSDLRQIRAGKTSGRVIGHEFAGVVVDAGPLVPIDILGTRVTGFPMITCLDCRDCRSGNHRDCVNKLSLGRDIDGSFSEFMKLDYRFLIKFPEELTFEVAALAEHLACGYRIAQEISRNPLVTRKSKLLIVGDGPIGIANGIFLARLGFESVEILGRNKKRLAIAEELSLKPVTATTIKSSYRVLVVSCEPSIEVYKLISSIKPSAIYSQVNLASPELARVAGVVADDVLRGFAYHFSDFFAVMEFLVSNPEISNKMVSRKMTFEKFSEEIISNDFHKGPYKTFLSA